MNENININKILSIIKNIALYLTEEDKEEEESNFSSTTIYWLYYIYIYIAIIIFFHGLYDYPASLEFAQTFGNSVNIYFKEHQNIFNLEISIFAKITDIILLILCIIFYIVVVGFRYISFLGGAVYSIFILYGFLFFNRHNIKYEVANFGLSENTIQKKQKIKEEEQKRAVLLKERLRQEENQGKQQKETTLNKEIEDLFKEFDNL